MVDSIAVGGDPVWGVKHARKFGKVEEVETWRLGVS